MNSFHPRTAWADRPTRYKALAWLYGARYPDRLQMSRAFIKEAVEQRLRAKTDSVSCPRQSNSG